MKSVPGWVAVATFFSLQFTTFAVADDGPWSFPEPFFFGLATAPAHVEDQLDDMWLEFAQGGHVPAWDRESYPGASEPGERLRFFSNPDAELDLVEDSGVQVFRMGVDWGRLVPDPEQCRPSNALTHKGFRGEVCELDPQALAAYDAIVANVRGRGLAVMMTLFHHSAPRWAAELGGWPNPVVRDKFVGFAAAVMEHYRNDVAYWNTFNEPAVYVLLTYVAGMWPPGEGVDATGFIPVVGDYDRALENMGAAHNAIYELARGADERTPYGLPQIGLPRTAQVGVAHNVSYHRPAGPEAIPQALFMRHKQNYQFVDIIKDHLDFLGLNYYGAEYISGAGLKLREDREYSDSGRAVEPYGLYSLLRDFHERYNRDRSGSQVVPFVVTENGISDSTDSVRPSYIIEHLLALRRAMDEGVPVEGYVFWTVSDNWEWADGYCPKFGLYHVDRSDPSLKRIKTPWSADLFREIVQSRTVTVQQRQESWERLMLFALDGGQREMCRGADGSTSLDQPEPRPATSVDWRFSGRPLDPPLPEEAVIGPMVTQLLEDNPLLSLEKFRELVGEVRVGQIVSDGNPAVEITLGHQIICDLVEPVFTVARIFFGDEHNRIIVSQPEELPGREGRPSRWRADIEGLYVKGYTPLTRVEIDSINFNPPANTLRLDPTATDVLSIQLTWYGIEVQERQLPLFGEPAFENCRAATH